MGGGLGLQIASSLPFGSWAGMLGRQVQMGLSSRAFTRDLRIVVLIGWFRASGTRDS